MYIFNYYFLSTHNHSLLLVSIILSLFSPKNSSSGPYKKPSLDLIVKWSQHSEKLLSFKLISINLCSFPPQTPPYKNTETTQPTQETPLLYAPFDTMISLKLLSHLTYQ